GTMTVYGHMQTVDVAVGDRVVAGQPIAGMGNLGFSTGTHLHFEVHVNDQPVDPVIWLAQQGTPLPGAGSLDSGSADLGSLGGSAPALRPRAAGAGGRARAAAAPAAAPRRPAPRRRAPRPRAPRPRPPPAPSAPPRPAGAAPCGGPPRRWNGSESAPRSPLLL